MKSVDTSKKNVAFIWAEQTVDEIMFMDSRVPDHVYLEQSLSRMVGKLMEHQEVLQQEWTKDKGSHTRTLKVTLAVLADKTTLDGIEEAKHKAHMAGMTDALAILREANGIAFERHVGAHFGIQCAIDSLSQAIVEEEHR